MIKIKKAFHCIVAIILSFILGSINIIPAFADDKSAVLVSSDYEISDEKIIENMRVRYDGSEIIIERITYPNNSSVTQIVEDGKTYRQEQFNNYDLLRSNLTIKNSPSLLRLEERFVTKMDQTEHVGPVASVYSVAFSAVSLVLGVYGLPGSAITGIVGMLIGLGGSTIEADIRTIRNFYGIYDVTGSFLGYYKVSYAVHTTAYNTDGSKIELKPEVGTYETLEIS